MVCWQYLDLESSFEGKDYVCERLLHFLLAEASSGTSEKLSFQLMEALLYRVHLNLFSGRMESALAVLQVSCWSTSPPRPPVRSNRDSVCVCVCRTP